MKRLERKVVVVTDGNGGIGLATVSAEAEKHWMKRFKNHRQRRRAGALSQAAAASQSNPSPRSAADQ
jgi:NAD(P)-dependent dehydrogenase (short-subunit alcohol dehydrogenase family)